MKMRLAPLAAAVIALLLTQPGSAGVESWADPKLPVKDGLVVWFDATRAWGNQFAPFDGKLAEWLDASGNGRHAKQPAEKARPVRLPVGPVAVVRFDGIDDHLRVAKKAGELKVLTLFVVAAPRQNPGSSRGVLALNASGKDSASGLNIDLGPDATPGFSFLSVEGRGFGGARNLRKGDAPFGRLHTFEVSGEEKAVRLTVDGKPEGERSREAGLISFEEIALGARVDDKGTVQGFGRVDVAEVLLFDRVLTAAETKSVREYLNAKYAALREAMPPEGDVLVTVKDPPPVQMLVPGFTVRELPVDLTNVNNVKYREDGALVALGYDGRIWMLKDTDGDGLEDKAELFWENKGGLRSTIGLDLTPPGYAHGDGVFVNGKTKCVLIVDADKDGKGDKEIEIAGGWKESFHQVDGLGVAIDPKDGSIYYGRGTYNFADPFLRDKDGKPQYSLKDEAAAIIRVSPDFKKREVVATGIRFPVGLHFNKAGDLFCTDQEGATWLANGNPLDELLHIRMDKVRHYGFPPRHPRLLPDVIDEPSTFDYGPQHQSACGFCFNEPVKKDGPVFGPKSWSGDAIVTGESRGKLYRTRLVKTDSGYVAKNQIIACLSMLTIDCCVAPDGSLVVACHSGGPDWGSGPTGKGKLFKITYTDKEHPQPVLVYPSGPREVRVEFDRPVDPQLLRDVLSQTKLTAGKFVRAGDRFETIWPGYAVVQAQKLAPRINVTVHSAQLTPDRRTLVLATDPLQSAVHYALTLSGMGRPAKEKAPKGVIPQHPEIDLDFDLSGVEATWSKTDTLLWSGWLPSLDLAVSRQFTGGSATHDALWKVSQDAGNLSLKTQLNLDHMLRPAVQPGGKLDYVLPPENVSLLFNASGSTKVIAKDVNGGWNIDGNASRAEGTLNHKTKPGQTPAVEFQIRSPQLDGPKFGITYSTDEDKKTHRPLQLHRALVPWADTKADIGKPVAMSRPKELEGGSWARGREIFFGETAACSKCHRMNAQGGNIGPDLSNLIHRDYASVVRDITQPSFAINPDHVAYVVRLKDDRTLTGVVRTAEGKLHVGDKDGKTTVVDKEDVAEMRASPLSVMPDDLLKKLTPEQARDLLTFLLTPASEQPQNPGAAKSDSYAEIRVVDAATGRGVPLVELETVNHIKFVTDNAGRIAFNEPGLMGREVFFTIRSHGYEVKKDQFGYAGARVTPSAGKVVEIKITRKNIAERLCRLTGDGRYRDTLLLGLKPPLADSPHPGNVAGQDSIQSVIYKNKVYWIWGDTSRMEYPLGLFRTAGATTPVPDTKNPESDPAAGIAYDYFVDPKTGFARAMIPLAERPQGVVWVFSLCVVPDEKGADKLVAHYTRRKGLVDELEHGIAVFNDEKQVFESAKQLPLKETWRHPTGHPIFHEEGGTKWILFGSPNPNVRVPATLKDVLDPDKYEAFTCAKDAPDGKPTEPQIGEDGKPVWRWQKELPPVDSKTEQGWVKAGKLKPEHARFCPVSVDKSAERIVLHSGTVRWNEYRKAWVLVAGQIGGKSSLLGEVWYSEAPHPTGPFTKAVRIMTHDKQTFYNVCHHGFMDRDGGKLIHFEGTYTNDFSGNPERTPRYNYNQMLYRLDLSSEALRAVRE